MKLSASYVSFSLLSSVLSHPYSFIPIVMLALVFNISNAVGFTYAYVKTYRFSLQSLTNETSRDRDAKEKWANQLGSGWGGIGGIGTTILSGVVKNSVGRVFR